MIYSVNQINKANQINPVNQFKEFLSKTAVQTSPSPYSFNCTKFIVLTTHLGPVGQVQENWAPDSWARDNWAPDPTRPLFQGPIWKELAEGRPGPNDDDGDEVEQGVGDSAGRLTAQCLSN